MFGASNTSSPFGGNNNGGSLFGSSNNNAQGSGGLFGNKASAPVSGGLFGNNNSTSTAANTSGGLFGNSNANTGGNTSGGGLFGNKSATGTPNGGLFGGNNGSTTTQGGLFGNNNAAGSAANTSINGLSGSATSSPAPSGGLFGNTANKPTMFGNNSASATPVSKPLFGGASSQQQTSSGLFGSNAAAPQANTPLFGNSNTNSTFNPVMNTTPMKQYNFKDLPKSLTDSTKKAIQNPHVTRKRSLSNTSTNTIPVHNGRSTLMERFGSRFSTLNSSAVYNSEGLFSPKKDFIQSTHTTEKQALSKPSGRGHYYKSFVNGTLSTRSSRAPRTTATDYLKLKVDQTRTDARRMKIFGDSGGARKVRILGRDDDNVLSIKETAESEKLNGDVNETHEIFTPPKDGSINEDEVEHEEVLMTTHDDDYWCSPSIEELQQLPLRQLAEIPGFTIGRRGYGVIRFELPVDLTAFWNDLPGQLFGKVVRFAKRGTVEVYPYERVPMGSGMNVPATITLEKVFPVSKSKTEKNDTAPRDLEYRLFVKKLRELKDMEFITYDPINGSWTFRVKHFSIWGLVNEDDAVIDLDEEMKKLKQEAASQTLSTSQPRVLASNPPLKPDVKRPSQRLTKSNNPTEDTFIYKKQKQDHTLDFDTTAFMPGSFITEDVYEQVARQQQAADIGKDDSPPPRMTNILSEMDSDDEILEDAKVPLGLIRSGDESFVEDDYGIVERQFEPENVDEVDFDILDADPKLAVSDDWDRQLELAGRFDSAFANTNLKNTTVYDAPFSKALTPGDLDKLLYGDFEKVVKSRNAIRKELRLEGYTFAKFSTANNVLVPSGSTSSHIAPKSLDHLYGTRSRSLAYKKHIACSKIVQRRNGFPHVAKNEQLNFKLVVDSLAFDAASSEKTVWELASVLFDDNVNNQLQGITDTDVISRVLEIQRREGLIAWIKKEVRSEIDTELETVTDSFEQIFLLLAAFNISSAAKLAIKTKNPHLAVLISLLGSNDPDVRYSAGKQLDDWKKQAVLQIIPAGLVKIYHLLKGDVLATGINTLSWKAKLGMLLCYGDLNDSLAELLSSFVEAEAGTVPVADLTYFDLLKLYVYRHDSSYSINDIFSSLRTSGPLDLRLQWYVYEILVRSTKQMTFGDSTIVGDKLAMMFAEQLQATGLVLEAFFVLAHLSSDASCERLITHFLNSRSDILTNDTLVGQLQDVLKVPASVISEAKALFYRYSGDHWKEASSLLDAEKFDEAHRTIVNYVAPAAVINNGPKLRELEKLIIRFPERRHVQDWNIGLSIYKNYLKLVFSKSTPEAPVRYLVETIPLMKQSNFKVKVATKLISKLVAVKLSELQSREGNGALDLHVDKTSRLPLGESERSMVGMLQNYLKKESLAV